jgi:hypothetical protein
MRWLVIRVSLAAAVVTSSACTTASPCLQTVDDALQGSWGDRLVGGGYVIRFVPGDRSANRGYDINVTRPVSEGAQMNTYFLRTATEISGISDGMPVLLVGDRTDRHFVLVAGACPALTPTTDDDVAERLGP